MNRLQIGQMVKAAGITIIPIEKISVSTEVNSHLFWWNGYKEPHALVVISPSRLQAFGIDGRDYDVNKLINSLPELAEILELGD
jgi:uncharacterized spore protein YtfJ